MTEEILGTATFESGYDGSAITRWDGRRSFPERRGPQPQIGEKWEVLKAVPNPKETVYFLTLGKRMSTKQERDDQEMQELLQHPARFIVQIQVEESRKLRIVTHYEVRNILHLPDVEGYQCQSLEPLFEIPANEDGAIWEAEVLDKDCKRSSMKYGVFSSLCSRLLRKICIAEEFHALELACEREMHGGFLKEELEQLCASLEAESGIPFDVRGWGLSNFVRNMVNYLHLTSKEQTLTWMHSHMQAQVAAVKQTPRILLAEQYSGYHSSREPVGLLRYWHTRRFHTEGTSKKDIYAASDVTVEEISAFLRLNGINDNPMPYLSYSEALSDGLDYLYGETHYGGHYE